jgi:MFS family permease
VGKGQVLEIGAALATGLAAAGFFAAFFAAFLAAGFLAAAFFAAGFLAAFLAAGFLAAAFFAAGFLAAFLAAGFLAAAFFAAGFLAAFLAAGFFAAAFFAAGFLAAAFLAAGFFAAAFFAAGFAAAFFTSGLAAFAFFAFFFVVAIAFLLHVDTVDKVTGRFEPLGSNHSFAQEKKAAVQRTTALCLLTPMNTGETARAEELSLATHGLGDAAALFPTEGTTRLILDHTGLEEVAFLFEVDHFGHPGERIFLGAKHRV